MPETIIVFQKHHAVRGKISLSIGKQKTTELLVSVRIETDCIKLFDYY